MKRRITRAAVTLAAAGALSVVGVAAASPTALTAATSQRVSVPDGLAAGIKAKATPDGITPSSTLMRVSFVLKARNWAQLSQAVQRGWQGPYLSVQQFAARYGQSLPYVMQLVVYLESFGIRAQVMPDLLDITTQGTAAQYSRALSVLFGNYQVTEAYGNGSGQTHAAVVFAPRTTPTMPADLASNILAVLGLTNYAPYESQAVKGIQPAATSASVPQSTAPFDQLPQAFEQDYNLTPVLNAGGLGQGQTMGIVTLASVNPEVPYYFWKNVAQVQVLPNRIHLVNVDGGSGIVSLNNGSDETTLDVEQSGTIAPYANIVVYQAPNTDYGFVDAFYAAASQDIAGSISCSWGESETAVQYLINSYQESPGYLAAFDQAFAESAAQGQSTFVASGDQGAYDPTGDIGTYNLGIDTPSDSSYTTAVGGTTLPGTQVYPITVTENDQTVTTGYEQVDIPRQITWGWDYMWPMYQALGFSSEYKAVANLIVGSGGGVSAIYQAPAYQQGVLGTYSDYQFLTPTDYQVIPPSTLVLPTSFTFNPTPSLATGSNTVMRESPDIAFNADPQTGYVVYDPQFKAPYGSSLVDFGGTSFIGPQVNGVTADYESLLGHRIGFWNPSIYRFATSAYSPFTPLDSNTVYGSSYYSGMNNGQPLAISGEFTNTNDYYTGTPGNVYNPGSGLGYANLTSLFEDFAQQ